MGIISAAAFAASLSSTVIMTTDDRVFGTGFESSVSTVLHRSAETFWVMDSNQGEASVTLAGAARLIIRFPSQYLDAYSGQSLHFTPLHEDSLLPTGQQVLHGVDWAFEAKGKLPAGEVEIQALENLDFAGLAAFRYEPGGEGFHFVPLQAFVEAGIRLKMPLSGEGGLGIAFVPLEAMQRWSTVVGGGWQSEAQDLAVIARQIAESETAASADHSKGGPTRESLVPIVLRYFDNEIRPLLNQAPTCDDIFLTAAPFVRWFRMIEVLDFTPGDEFTPDSINIRFALASQFFGTIAAQIQNQIDQVAQQCATADPCDQLDLVNNAIQCDVAMNMLSSIASVDYNPAVLDSICPEAFYKVTVEPSISLACAGDTPQLTATVQSLTAPANPVITWSSSNQNVATVSQAGRVTVRGPGAAVITASLPTSCPPTRIAGKAVVSATESVPWVVGDWLYSGAETSRGCTSEFDNQTEWGEGIATFISQTRIDAGRYAFSGESDTGLGSQVSGSLFCGGLITGSGSYSEVDQCIEDPDQLCVYGGTTAFTGSIHSNVPALGDLIFFDYSSEDTSGDTCASRGWGVAIRPN